MKTLELHPIFTRETVKSVFDGKHRLVTVCTLVDEEKNIMAVGLAIKSNEDHETIDTRAKARDLSMLRAKALLELRLRDSSSVLCIPKAWLPGEKAPWMKLASTVVSDKHHRRIDKWDPLKQTKFVPVIPYH